MKKTVAHRIVSLLASAAMLSASLPAFAAGEASVELHFAAYYNAEGRLIGARKIKGSLSKDEVDALVDIYEPENAEKAKVFEWKENLEPATESRTVDIADEPEAVILHTNDMHGALVGSSSVIGSDSVAALKQLDDAILADAGDAVQGVALASQSRGESVIKIMNAAKYDVMAAGNHEFDYGLDRFKELRDLANFPIISANTYKGDALLCADSDKNNGANVLIDKNGVKVGIFALTTQNTVTSTKPENVAGIDFKDEVTVAQEQVQKLDEAGADVIVALTHMGETDEGACTSRQLADKLKDTELDAIIDGHTHHEVNEKVGDITIAQTGTGSVNVGRMEINVDENGGVEISETMLSRAFFDNITPDAQVTNTITEENAELSKTLEQEIGETKTTLWGGSIRGLISEGRVGETNFGSLICDAMIDEAKNIVPDEYKNLPIVAIENGGGYRASVPNGKITIGHIINALPFANNVRIMKITPKKLYEALEGYISSVKYNQSSGENEEIGVTAQDTETGFLTASYEGSFPQIGGMRIRYNPNNPVGGKIESITLENEDKTALEKDDDTTKLILASHDYIIGTEDMIAEGSGLTETVTAYIKSLTENGTKPLDLPVTLGRITTTAHTPDNYTYTAHITLTNANSLEAGSEVPVYVDGEPYDKAAVVTDEVINIPGKDEGGNEIVKETVNVRTLNIELPDGPHAIKLFPEQEEVYVNNYSGNGILYTYNGLTLKYPELEYDVSKIEQPAG